MEQISAMIVGIVYWHITVLQYTESVVQYFVFTDKLVKDSFI